MNANRHKSWVGCELAADQFRDATKWVDWVIKAMGYGDDEANEAIRLSWCHLTSGVDWETVSERVEGVR